MECKDEIYSASQYSSVKLEIVNNNNNNNSNKIPNKNNTTSEIVPDIVVTKVEDNTETKDIVEKSAVRKPLSSTAKLFGDVLKDSDRPQTATTKIFGPRTKEMNKGFLMFSDEAPGLTSKFFYLL